MEWFSVMNINLAKVAIVTLWVLIASSREVVRSPTNLSNLA